jgi:Ni,Fe-hydrogenase I large subunit
LDSENANAQPVLDVIAEANAALGMDVTAINPATGVPYVVSLLGRVAARVLELYAVSKLAEGLVAELVEELRTGKAEFWAPYKAENGEGAGLWEAPRGALAHFINTKGGKISRYQVITPSTWDLGPKADDGTPGPMEAALIGTPIADIERPIEAARIVRSFDP